MNRRTNPVVAGCVFIVAGVLAAWAIGVGIAPVRAQQPGDRPASGAPAQGSGVVLWTMGRVPTAVIEQRVDAALTIWNGWLAKRAARSLGREGLTSLLRDFARDHGSVQLGGSGAEQLVFLIDDFVQISAVVDAMGKMQAGPTAERRSLWLKHPDGQLELFDRGN